MADDHDATPPQAAAPQASPPEPTMGLQPPPPPGPDATGAGPDATRVMRWREDKLVAGVARGLAHWFGVDPVWVRLLFVATALWGGIGLIAYVALAVALPEVDSQPADTAGSRERQFWLGAAGIGTLWLATAWRGLPDFQVVVPLALVAIGILLWQRPRNDTSPRDRGAAPSGRPDVGTPNGPDRDAAATVAPAATTPGRPSWAPPGDAGSGGPGAPQTPPDEPLWWEAPSPRPRPSWLGPVALVAAAVVAAFQYGLDLLGVVDVSLTQGLATALAILGTAMVVGTVRGRAKWLVAPAAVLVAMLFVVASSTHVGVDLGQALGRPVDQRVTDPEQVEPGVGSTRLDLTGDDVADGEAVEVSFGAGSLEIVVPWDADVRLDVDLGIGVAAVQDRPFDGPDRVTFAVGGEQFVDEQVSSPWAPYSEAVPTSLDVAVRMGAGVVTVVHGAPPPDVLARAELEEGAWSGPGGHREWDEELRAELESEFMEEFLAEMESEADQRRSADDATDGAFVTPQATPNEGGN